MFASSVNTITVPLISGPSPTGGRPPSPATIIETSKWDCVVRVRNNSFAVNVLIAFDPALLSTFPPRAGTWKIPAGGVDSFILKGGQGLFASRITGLADPNDVEISVHIFQSLPVDGSELT